MRKLLHIAFSLSIILCSTSCNRNKEVLPEAGENIFPVQQGQYSITEVVDTSFNSAGPVVEKYFKKEEIGSTFTDLDGRPIQRVQVSLSDYDLGTNYQFEPSRVWGQFLETNTESGEYFAERIEDNTRYLVLRFPVFDEARWNGHLFNNLGNRIFNYQSTDTTVVVRGKRYEDCVMVVQRADTSSFITYSFIYEIYAPEIGKIKRFERTLVNDGPNGEFNPSRSRIYLEELVESN
ncbi:MAG: hypothetical protein AAFR66_14175 [Bacteroidota bacterium]